MIVVLASPRDAAARAFADRTGAVCVGPADLSRPGWRWTSRHGLEQAVIDGEPVDPRAIDGVVTRFAWVPEADLGHIHADDRRYLADEMSAFLLTWLSELRCPVVNPPGGTSLCGPGWGDARWSSVAARAGVATPPRRWPAGPLDEAPYALDVIDGRAVTDAPAAAVALAERFAHVSGMPALRVHVTGGAVSPRFHSADPWVALDRAPVADAVLDVLAGVRR